MITKVMYYKFLDIYEYKDYSKIYEFIHFLSDRYKVCCLYLFLHKIHLTMSKYGAYLLLVFTMMFIDLSAQMDSLITAFKEATTPEISAIIVNKITDKCGADMDCIRPFYDALEEIKADERILNTYYTLGNNFFRKGSILNAKEIYLRGMRKAKDLNPYHKSLLNYYSSLSNVYHMSNIVNADSAFFYIGESEKIIKVQGMEEENYWKPNYNRYLVYIAAKNFKKADEYLIKSYGFLKNSANRMNKGFVMHTLLQATKSRGNKNEFNKYLDEFIRFKKAGNKELDINHLGMLEVFTDKEEAKKLLEESLKRVENVTKPTDSPDARRIELAEIYTEEGEIDKAIEQYIKVTKDPILKGHGLALRNAHYALYEAYKKKNQPKDAYDWIEKYIALEDSMSNENFKIQVADYEVKYQTKEKENQLIKQELELKSASLRTRTLWAVISGLCFIFFTIGFLYFRNVRFKTQMMLKDNEIRDQKIKELEHTNKLLSLNSVIEGQEAERLRIAQDLHDGLGGLLTTVKAHFQSIQKEIQQLENLNIYNKTNKLIDEACIEVRRIAHDMVPYSIKISGLKGALEDLKESVIARGLPCELEIFNGDDLKLNEQHSNMLYRIIQEITTNAVKHANATKLFIQLMCHKEGLNILIEDNGKGFDINHLLKGGGMGLKSIDSRVSYLSGKINYDSSPGHGTTINIEIPLNILTDTITPNQN